MNKRSKIKSTLDSLFTSGKLPSGEAEPKPQKSAAKLKTVKSDPAKSKPEKPVKPSEPVVEKTVLVEEIPVQKEPVTEELPAKVAVPLSVEESKIQEPLMEKPVEKIPVPQNNQSENATGLPAAEKKKIEEEVQKITREIDISEQTLSGDEEHLVIFSLDREHYGVNIHAVESIIKLQAITEVPRSASFILGVTNLRGTVVPVLDLRKRFNMCACENTANSRIIIVNAEGSKVGILVDEVAEVLKVARESIQPPPPMSTTIDSAFINGIARIGDRLVILLDLEKVLISSSRQHNR